MAIDYAVFNQRKVKILFSLNALKTISTLALITLTSLVNAAALRPDHPIEYQVTKKDTLWTIASRFYSEPWQWQDIWYHEEGMAEKQNVYPGDRVHLVYDDGDPKLKVLPGRLTDMPYVRLSPSVRKTPLKSAIPIIPMSSIEQFLEPVRVESEEVLGDSPYVAALDKDRVMANQGDTIYVRGLEEVRKEGYGIYRPGEAYVDPETKEILGYEVIYLGKAKLRRTGDPATLTVTESVREILVTDILLPIQDIHLQREFVPHAPDMPLVSSLISVYGGVSQIGQYNLVMINKGELDGVEPGHVLGIYQSGDLVYDPYHAELPKGERTFKVPDEKAALMMVVRTFDQVSMGIVLKATRVLHLLDIATNP